MASSKLSGWPWAAAVGALVFFISAPQARHHNPEEADTGSSAQEQPIPARQLYPAGTVEFATSGPGAVAAGVQCDADGNVYMNSWPSAQMAYQNARRGLPPLTRLSPGSKSSQVFKYPSLSDYAHQLGRGYYVDPRGNVYAMVEACRYKAGCGKPPHWGSTLIVKYNDDGTTDSVTELHPPSRLHADAFRFAVFLDGNILVTGLERSGTTGVPSGPFTAIFDRGGGYVGQLALPNDVAPPEHWPQSKESGTQAKSGEAKAQHASQNQGGIWFADVQESLMVGATDGTLYLIRATSPARLYTISPAGTVLSEHIIKAPETGMRPLQASLAGGGLLIEFSQAPTGREPHFHQAFELINPETGKIAEAYDVPSEAGIPACETRQGVFLFLKSGKSGQLEIAKYVPQ